VEGFFWNLSEFGRRIQFDVLHSCKMRPLEAHFQNTERMYSLIPVLEGLIKIIALCVDVV